MPTTTRWPRPGFWYSALGVVSYDKVQLRWDVADQADLVGEPSSV
jgi:hypothetical protein